MHKHLHIDENPFLHLTPPPSNQADFQVERRKHFKTRRPPNGYEGLPARCTNAFRMKPVAVTDSNSLSTLFARGF